MFVLFLSGDLNETRLAEGKKGIVHSFDLWHLSKNLGKKLANVSALR